mmetsp:Transcript_13521/g.32030  ORF Transcript_13521/g.32030 Transcript_13521/m.32030 type:complete len:359 (+) Transcript_13521:76-1152(+)|eukprot:CAMPEP_0181266702 /NCGR_PEP_ID=MMETSP1097-20121128/4437_1 /TAXON_ID=35684 /ORGANISM="Pseudopedinella elastica, Strain CCMP716" /LENGTH=358 /DNA_ID=CAMNT_0023365939 /DNA_START=10 /DNA_END=1086 /DNA_ORIENTATION=-
MTFKVTLILALCLGLGNAFTPGTIHNRALKKPLTKVSMSDDGVVRLSEIADESTQGPAWKKYEAENAGVAMPGINPEGNYDGLVDCDGFDGGDGQVGVVGDGSNAMEEFDTKGLGYVTGAAATVDASSRIAINNAIGGAESKKTQKNAFGMTTGYAEKLAEEGMVELDETGADRLATRRQQLENWRNQQEIRGKQTADLEEMAAFTGVEYDSRAATQSYMNALANAKNVNDDAKWNMYQGEAKADAATEAATLQKGDITDTLVMQTAFPSPSFAEISVQNDLISFQDFVVGFSPDSVNGGADFAVSPLSGELNGRRGEPTTLSVTFKPLAPGGAPRVVYLVVETEESKWTYEITGNVA